MRISKSQKGVTAIEYALLAAMFAIGCIAAVNLLGNLTTSMYDKIKDAIVGAKAD